MTTAELINNVPDYDEQLILADEFSIYTAQDYETESSEFTFEDGSVCFFDGLAQKMLVTK